jgi:hypothetical protein
MFKIFFATKIFLGELHLQIWKTRYHSQHFIIYDLDQNGKGSGLPPVLPLFVRTCMRLLACSCIGLVQFSNTAYMLTLLTVIWLTQTACISFMVFINCYKIVNVSYFLCGVWERRRFKSHGKIIKKNIQTLILMYKITVDQEWAPHIFCSVHWYGVRKRTESLMDCYFLSVHTLGVTAKSYHRIQLNYSQLQGLCYTQKTCWYHRLVLCMGSRIPVAASQAKYIKVVTKEFWELCWTLCQVMTHPSTNISGCWCVTPSSWISLGKLVKWSRNFVHLMEPESTLLCVQQPVLGISAVPVESSQSFPVLFL